MYLKRDSTNYLVQQDHEDLGQPAVYFKRKDGSPLSKRVATFEEVQRYDQLQATLRVEALLTEVLTELRNR